MSSLESIPGLQLILSNLPYIVAILIALLVLQNLSSTIRNTTNSDLWNIPEPHIPFWKRFTVGHHILYMVTAADAFKVAYTFHEWRRRCGPIFKLRSLFGARSIVITSDEAIRTLFITKPRLLVKTRVAVGFLSPFVGNDGILVAEGDRHKKLRRAVAPAMHHEALMTVGRVFLAEGRLLADRLADMADEGGDVLREVRVATFGVIFQTCFGNNAMPDAELEKLQKAYLDVFLEPPLHMMISFLLRQWLWFVDPFHFTYRKDLKRYIRNVVYGLCKDRMDGNLGSCEDTRLLSLMVDAETNKAMTTEELVGTVMSFLAAGQATTSMSVAWTVYILGREPKWQEKVAKELKTWSEEDGLEVLDRLPLLGRVVRESLRLYPPVFQLVRRASEDFEVEGYKLPKDTYVRMPILAIQRDPGIWGADADVFNPDRFLREGELARTRMYWCGFTFGQRNCIGQRFALLEIKAFIAQLVKRQEIYIKPSEDPAPTCRGMFATPLNMKVYFRSRKCD